MGLVRAKNVVAVIYGHLWCLAVIYLIPATERIQQDRERVERQNHRLEELVGRRQAFVERLRGFLADARREREAIDSELA